MFKLLRKYNKLLLAIFGVLLMITFLIPQAMSQFARESGSRRATIATVGDGDRVTGEQWHQVQTELDLLQKAGASIPGLGPIRDIKPEHWYLLTREAAAAGLVPVSAAVALDEDQFRQIAIMTGVNDPVVIQETFAKFTGVQHMLQLFESGGLYSDRRLKRAAEKLLSQSVAQLVVLEGDSKRGPEPTEDEINAQFAKYADVMPGEGETGFGYKLPDRVKLEWLKISTDSIREAVRQSEQFSTVAQWMHWRRYEKDPAKNFPPQAEAAAPPEIVVTDLLNQLTREKTEEIAKYAADQLRLNRRGIPEKDGYVVLPADWDQKNLAFPQLAQMIQAKFGVELPSYQSQGEWVEVSDIYNIEGIGMATSDKLGSSPVLFADLVAATRELNPGPTSIFIQQDVAGPPLKGIDGSIYLFRVVATEPSHKPQSVDEVRDKVVADLKRVADFKRLADAAAEIEREAETKGLLGLALDRGTHVERTTTLGLCNIGLLMQQVQSGMPVSARPTSLPVIGSDREAVEAAVDYVLSLPPTTAVDDLPEEQRVFTVAIPEKQALLVFRLMHRNPLTQEDFAFMVQLGAIQRLIAAEESKDDSVMKEAFGFEVLAKRNKFAFSRGGEEEQAAEPAAQTSANAG